MRIPEGEHFLDISHPIAKKINMTLFDIKNFKR